MLTRNNLALAVRSSLLASAATAVSFAYPMSSFAAESGSRETVETIVVTGSIIRRTDAETPSPVTVVSAEMLEERGINTISEAVQRLTANNAGTIQQGWNTGFNFASGANAPALRGLTVQATLSVADGLRIAPYPLADDGQRNFVDLNTIPSAIVERVEVLRDGASSTYGADAIAGVVNIITKKEVLGFHVGGSTGLSEEGGADENRIDLTWGTGSLAQDGYNFYVSGEYQKQDPLWARDRGYPFNSTDWSRKCGPSGSCMSNLNWNGVTQEAGDDPSGFNGLFSIPGVSLVRPVDAGENLGAGRYAYLNPSAGCRQWATTTLTPAQAEDSPSPVDVCEVDLQNAYIMLQPEVERTGLSMRFTADIGEQAQLYIMANFYKTDTFASFTPLGFNGALPPPNPPGLASANVILPVYVCNGGVGTFNGEDTGCDATNGTLNPYNPYAASGQRAQILLRSPFGRTVETSSRARRGVIGLDGGFGDSWSYSASITVSEIGLTRIEGNYMIPQRIWDAAARGTFNFSDPYATSQETWDYIAPDNRKYSLSRLWQMQGTISKELLDLPGGALAAAVGVSYREESIDAPSGNPADFSEPYSRHYSINAVGTEGERDVKSTFFELSAPVLKQVELLASGRYDEYSTGQSSFSPKLGIKITPIEQLAVRGTWSQGFRIPSFNEAFGLPTTGYVSREVDCDAFPDFCAAHGNNAYAGQYNLGLTQTGNAELDPEESESFTAGVVFEPVRSLSLTFDYWRIEVDGLITGLTDTSAVEAAYYANNGVVDIPGLIVSPGAPDPAFPNALPVLGFIESSFTNQNRQTVSGYDFGANLTLPVGAVTLRSSLELSYLDKYELENDAGDVFRYEGTLSPCNITSCSGAPEWRGAWQNTVDFDNSFGHTTLSLITYYTSGYDTASLDFGGLRGECEGNARNHASTQTYVDGSPVNCRAKATWNVDLTARHQINDTYTVFVEVLNVLGIEPEFDPSAAYGLFGYNPAWGGPNIMGRYYRVGVKMGF
jgi:iron complex outermembrane recepter protein